jgi:hypothetical protein
MMQDRKLFVAAKGWGRAFDLLRTDGQMVPRRPV